MKRVLFLAASALFAACALAQSAKQPDIDAGAVFVVAQKPLDGSPYHRAVAVVAPLPVGGHFGLVLNRTIKPTLAQLFPSHAPSKAVRGAVHFGGLYEIGTVFAMVPADVAPPPAAKALAVMPGVWLVIDADAIDRIIEEKPNAARFYTGIIVWEPGLLREQIRAGQLAVLEADPALLFLEDTTKLHDELSRKLLEAGRVKHVRH